MSTSAVSTPSALAEVKATSPGLWQLAWRRLRRDRFAMVSLAVLAAFIVAVVLSLAGVLAPHWDDEVGVSYAPPNFVGPDTESVAIADAAQAAAGGALQNEERQDNPYDPLADVIAKIEGRDPAAKPSAAASAASDTSSDIVDPLAKEMNEIKAAPTEQVAAKARAQTLPFGADKWGHDIIQKTVKGAETSIVVGLLAALVSVALGTFLGALAGYYGRWIDDLSNWFYSVFTAVPYLLLILAVAAVLQKRGVVSIVLILGLTGWTGVFRLIRSEYIKHRSREYVQAANAIGASHMRRMFVHILPNVSHVALVQLSILTVGFIKAEVVLSFLGFGVPVGTASWGSMLNEAQNELILGKWWQLVAATGAMAVLVTAFSVFTDALRDALDPKLRGGKA